MYMYLLIIVFRFYLIYFLNRLSDEHDEAHEETNTPVPGSSDRTQALPITMLVRYH